LVASLSASLTSSVKFAVKAVRPLLLLSVNVLFVVPEKLAPSTTPSTPEPPVTLSSAGAHSVPFHLRT